MKPQFLRADILISCLLFLAIGGAGGWVLSLSFSKSGHEAHDEAEDVPEAGDGHSAHLSEAALKNLGVMIGEINKTNFQNYRAVPAVVDETPFTELPLHAPMGGRILKIHVEKGMLVEAGRTLITLVRDPIPRPELKLVEDVLKPASEDFHRTLIELRKAREEVRIFKTELDRVQKFTNGKGEDDFPVLPLKTAIDLRYNFNRAQKAYDLARVELSKHGYSKEQVEQLATHEQIPQWGTETWKRALKTNGLWNTAAEELYNTLPKPVRLQPWVVATVGELFASDLNRPELVAWLKATPKAGRNFLEIASLLQRGHSVEDIKVLYRMNAFEALIEIIAQNGKGAADFDVHEILVKPGASVEKGAPLLNLVDSRQLYLRTELVGGEKTEILAAVVSSLNCRATPLVAKAGPILDDLKIAYVTNQKGAQGTVAYVEIENQPLTVSTDKLGRKHRTWKLRPGLKYSLLVPTNRIENVYVLPSGAITEEGPEKVVYVQDGDSFKSVKVEIAYQDHEVAVIPINKRTKLFPGDRVVLRGAFALGLAMQAGTGEVDPHAGHSH